MEKDKVQTDDACQKRSRNKTQSSNSTVTSSTTTTVSSGTAATSSSSSSSSSSQSGSTVKVGSPVNGSTLMEEARSSRNSNYSITSLLSEDRSSSTTKRCSPEANSPSHYSGTGATRSQYCSPTPPSEDGWYSESVDRLRSIELSVSIATFEFIVRN